MLLSGAYSWSSLLNYVISADGDFSPAVLVIIEKRRAIQFERFIQQA